MMRLLLLAFALILVACGEQRGETLRFEQAEAVTLSSRSHHAQTITHGHLLATQSGRRLRLTMGNPGDQTVTLMNDIILAPQTWKTFEVTPHSDEFTLAWSPADVELLLAEPFVLPKTKPDQKNVLLISIDTLRYDHFTPEHMPQLWSIFEQGERFEKVHTTAPWTLPAHASLFTGQYPAQHGVRLPDHKLSKEAGPTLAELLQDAGYWTVALTEGNYMSAAYGLARGFHHFEENPPQMMSQRPEDASKLGVNVARTRELIEQAGSAATFMLLHTYEVHCPYLPLGGREDPEQKGSTQWLLDNDGKALPAEDYQHLMDLYQGEVALTDQLLAPLVRDLLATDQWIVVMISDHGEEFGEHGGLLHADTLYEEALHVPVAIAGHGRIGSIDTAGSLIDVPVTLLSLLDLPSPDHWQGLDLGDPNTESRPLFGESFFLGPQIPAEDPRILGVWSNGDKLIQTRNFEKYSAELYRLPTDPGELQNLATEEIRRRDALFVLIEAYLKGRGADPEAVGELTPEQIETLRSLGYIQ